MQSDLSASAEGTKAAMSQVIYFDERSRIFFLRMKSTFYAMGIIEDGQLIHMGSGSLPGHLNIKTESSCGKDKADQLMKDALSHLLWQGYEDPNYVWTEQSRRYELITFGDVTYHDVALKTAFPELGKSLETGEEALLPVRDLRLRYQGHEIVTDACPGLTATHGQSPEKTSPRPTLKVHLKDMVYDFRVTLCYRITAEHDILERWVELENATAMQVEIESLSFGSMHLPEGPYELHSSAGGWAREFVEQKNLLLQGRVVLDQQGLNTGHSSNPFYLLHEPGQASEESGLVYFGCLGFSGNWSLRFETLSTQAVRIHGGYETGGLGITLMPGQKHKTPAWIIGCCNGGLGGASRRMHQFMRDCVLPGASNRRHRPVLYNGWEATYFDLSQDNQIELARKAASLGVELFCVDDGWFGGRRSDKAGLGDWHVSNAVFPHGLGPLVAEVKKLGMKFGLWVEPEMVNPDSQLYREHPNWVLHYPGRPRTEKRWQLILDLGRPEVVDFIYASLDRLVRENQVDFFKWDMNRYVSEGGSVAGKQIWQKHVQGLYGIMDRLRAAHPHLDIQSCSGGGGRVDAGILQRVDQVWTSDNTDAFDRVYIQDGFSLIYPQDVMESWVTHENNHQTGRRASLNLRFDVAMRGVLGIGAAINKLSEEDLAHYRRKIAFYKRIRPILTQGKLYRLRTAKKDSRLAASIWQTVLGDGTASIYSAVVLHQEQGLHLPAQKLHGLQANAEYVVKDEFEKEVGRYRGIQLMTLGLPGDSCYGGIARTSRSRTLLIEKA